MESVYDTGPPDAELCQASTRAWLPTVDKCDQNKCILFLQPQFSLPVSRLSVWFAWNAANGVEYIRLHYLGGGNRTLRHITAFCDQPFSVLLDPTDKAVEVIEIKTRNPYVSIDAAEFESLPNQEVCSACKNQATYRLFRKPAFKWGEEFVDISSPHYWDRETDSKQTYEYSVTWLSHGQVNFRSNVFQFTGSVDKICGDGRIDEGETCDDGNIFDGDGCQFDCQLERGYFCSGSPSACYMYENDGVCEWFEQSSSVADCGHYTPDGFEDQWVSSAVLSSCATGKTCVDRDECTLSRLPGPPNSHELMCKSGLDFSAGWRPCPSVELSNAELRLYFAAVVLPTAVLVHISSDGFSQFQSEPKQLQLWVIDENNYTHYIESSKQVSVSCGDQPLQYNIPIYAHEPLIYTKEVRLRLPDRSVAISAVRLRSWRHFDPRTISKCSTENMLYQAQTGQCVQAECAQPVCNQPNVINAILNCTGSDSGDACLVSCRQGHLLIAKDGSRNPRPFLVTHFDAKHNLTTSNNLETNNLLTTSKNKAKLFCYNGRWMPDGLVCVAADCGKPTMAHAQITCPNGTNYNNQCQFSCRRPAIMRGTANTIDCLESGVWSVPEAYCQLSCGSPRRQRSLDSSSLSRHCRLNYQLLDGWSQTYPIGTRCRFVCELGTHVDGEKATSRLYRLSCNGQGEWKGQQCVPVNCGEPELPSVNLITNCSRGYYAGSECMFTCPDDDQTWYTTECGLNGTWSLDNPCTQSNKTCVPPVSTGDLLVLCPNETFVGSICELSCSSEGYEPVREHYVKAVGRNLRMQVLQRTPAITCSSHRSWQPLLNSLVCVRQCSEDFLSDGWCDFQNNRGFCSFDGGDCCSSTVKGGRVRLMFPALCTSQLCQCLDPFAIENRRLSIDHAKLIRVESTLEMTNEDWVKLEKSARQQKLRSRDTWPKRLLNGMLKRINQQLYHRT